MKGRLEKNIKVAAKGSARLFKNLVVSRQGYAIGLNNKSCYKADEGKANLEYRKEKKHSCHCDSKGEKKKENEILRCIFCGTATRN